jgi:hypothetical protein
MTSIQNLQPGDEHAYDAMAQAAQRSVSELLIPFKAASDAEGLLRAMSIEEFFTRFIVYADKFTNGCCQDFAKIMRQCADVAEIRGTPTLVVAKQIRAEVFEPFDGILVSYIRACKELEMDLSGITAELRDSNVMDAALKGAAIGQLAGGLGSSGKTLGTINALLQAGVEAEKQLALLQQKAALIKQAEAMTIPKIVEYLKAVRDLPERLLDYGCAKCFGGRVSLDRQREALERVSTTVAHEVDAAISLTGELAQVQERLEQQKLLALKEKEEHERDKPRPGRGVLLVAASVGMVMLSLQSCGIVGDNKVITEGDMVWGLILMIGAPFVLLWGIAKCAGVGPKASGSGATPGGGQSRPSK